MNEKVDPIWGKMMLEGSHSLGQAERELQYGNVPGAWWKATEARFAVGYAAGFSSGKGFDGEETEKELMARITHFIQYLDKRTRVPPKS